MAGWPVGGQSCAEDGMTEWDMIRMLGIVSFFIVVQLTSGVILVSVDSIVIRQFYA